MKSPEKHYDSRPNYPPIPPLPSMPWKRRSSLFTPVDARHAKRLCQRLAELATIPNTDSAQETSLYAQIQLIKELVGRCQALQAKAEQAYSAAQLSRQTDIADLL